MANFETQNLPRLLLKMFIPYFPPSVIVCLEKDCIVVFIMGTFVVFLILMGMIVHFPHLVKFCCSYWEMFIKSR